MIEIAWIVLQDNERFLLTQRSFVSDDLPGLWVFPGGKIEPRDATPTIAADRELNKKTGVEAKHLRKLCCISMGQYNVRIFLCDRWNIKPRPCNKMVGIGWFTWIEMYRLGKSLAPFVNDSIAHLSYLIQHYNHHPEEWLDQWERRDANG